MKDVAGREVGGGGGGRADKREVSGQAACGVGGGYRVVFSPVYE